MIHERFQSLKSRGEKALVLFVTAGDPDLGELPAILSALEEGGADIIEIGIPFSDPIADGPVIQASSQRALDRGVTPSAALDAIAKAGVSVPIVLMGYANPIFRIGAKAFADRAVAVGASGMIVCDMIPEEAGSWIEASRAAGLDSIFLTAPTSTDERLEAACKATTGFVYAVSRTGVTGAQTSLSGDVGALVARLRKHTDLPICVGFGISTPDHVKEVCSVADGAIIGSWLVDFLAREWQGGAGRQKLVDAVRALKAATR